MLRHVSATALIVTICFSSWSTALAQEKASETKSLKDGYIVGEWTFEGTMGDKDVKGTMRVRPGAGDTCLVFNWTTRARGQKPVRGTAIGGEDPQTGEWVEYNFESNQSHYIGRYKLDSNLGDVGKGFGKLSGIFNGKPHSGEITLDRKGRDHFIYMVDSKDGDDWKFDYRRAKDGLPKSKATTQQSKKQNQ